MTEQDDVVKAMLLAEWEATLKLTIAAKEIIEREQALRKEVAEIFFPTPTEGPNIFDLANGWKLKLTYKIDRKIDEATLPAVRQKLTEMNVSTDNLINMKPSLDTKAYKALVQTLPDAAKVFEEALIIKPASPTCEIVAPKIKE